MNAIKNGKNCQNIRCTNANPLSDATRNPNHRLKMTRRHSRKKKKRNQDQISNKTRDRSGIDPGFFWCKKSWDQDQDRDRIGIRSRSDPRSRSRIDVSRIDPGSGSGRPRPVPDFDQMLQFLKRDTLSKKFDFNQKFKMGLPL